LYLSAETQQLLKNHLKFDEISLLDHFELLDHSFLLHLQIKIKTVSLILRERKIFFAIFVKKKHFYKLQTYR